MRTILFPWHNDPLSLTLSQSYSISTTQASSLTNYQKTCPSWIEGSSIVHLAVGVGVG